MHSVIIAIGTNLGNRRKNINIAIQKMKENGIDVEKISPVYETAPYGYTEQPAFLNCAILGKTNLSPHELLDTLLSIEKEMGRVRKIHWGPRIIDLDIIFYDNLIIDEPNLKIPHPDMQNREFVLKPISDIAPCFVHPKFCKTVKTLYEELKSGKGAETS
jgi:2-amino-4-hydroxy-6-hydroxymethyldihydropteridine diphosphokinase